MLGFRLKMLKWKIEDLISDIGFAFEMLGLMIAAGAVIAFLFMVSLLFRDMSLVKDFIGRMNNKDPKMSAQGTHEKDDFVGNIFSGLSSDEARRRYRELLKENHPDNGGSETRTAWIINEYREYRGEK